MVWSKTSSFAFLAALLFAWLDAPVGAAVLVAFGQAEPVLLATV